MDINFVKLLEKTRDGRDALFSVNGKHIKIGVSDTLLSVWNVQRCEKTLANFLKQFGTLKIRWMLAENLLDDYTFVSEHFKKENGDTMSVAELDDYLKGKIIAMEDKLT